MAKVGKIAPIDKNLKEIAPKTLQGSLAANKYFRYPGSGLYFTPFKEASGKYRTGLDPEASYIKRILDESEQEIEIERVTKLKKELEDMLQTDLGPYADFWNSSKTTSNSDTLHVQPYRLGDSGAVFNLEVPLQKLTYAWMRVHPAIAPSYKHWESGMVPADISYYIVDEEIEATLIYKKKKEVNKAIVLFDSLSVEKKRKVGRLLGLPITEQTAEDVLYNLIDTLLKQGEVKEGVFKGSNPIDLFNRFATMDDKILNIKSLIQEALDNNVYRERPTGKIYEGEFEVALDKDELLKKLVDDANQEDLIVLEQKVKTKKLASAI